MSRSLESRPVEIDGDAQDVNDYFEEHEWTDGLPIIPPTEETIWRMIDASGLPPDHLVATVPPLDGGATIEVIAINAVMAGCRPEYMPIVVAAVEAMCEESFNLTSVQCSTNPAGVAVILNGPARHSVKMNCRGNCLGPGTRSNATIGRTVRLIMLNVGGGKPQLVDKAVLGYPGKYTLCFGELEEESPWDPLHVDRGFNVHDSVVTTVAVNSTLNILIAGFFDAREKLSFITDPFNLRGTSNVMVSMGEVVVVLTPPDANIMAEAGFSKADVQNYIYDNSGFPEDQIPRTMERRERIEAVTKNGIIRAVRRPEDILVVVAGGAQPYHAAVMPTLGASWSASSKVKQG